MFEELDRALERWLRAEVPLPTSDVEFSFDQPQGDWGNRRSTPMVNAFLYATTKSTQRMQVGDRLVPGDGGGLARIRAVPLMEARYLLSAWASNPSAEHEMLGRVVHLIAANRAIPDRHLGQRLTAAHPRPSLSLDPDRDTSIPHLWSGLGVSPRPAIQLTVHVPTGLETATAMPAPPSAVDLGVGDLPPAAAYQPRRRRLAPAGRPGSDDGREGPRTRIADSGRRGEYPDARVSSVGLAATPTGEGEGDG